MSKVIPNNSSLTMSHIGATADGFRPNYLVIHRETVQLLAEFHGLENQLELIFAHSPLSDEPGINHHTLTRFRGRVSRRIARCSAIVKALWRIIDSLNDSDLQREIAFRYQLATVSLARNKSLLSEWWRMNERRFHQLRMNDALSIFDGDRNHPAYETKALLEIEGSRMQEAAQQLARTSTAINESERNLTAHHKLLEAAQYSIREIERQSDITQVMTATAYTTDIGRTRCV